MILQLFLLSIYVQSTLTVSPLKIKKTLRDIPEDGVLDFMEISRKYDHEAIEHKVTTEDGYILTLYNIPGDIEKPVLLCHGLFDTSDGFLISGNTSLIITLANAGYDVWVLNARGNRYSRNHTSLDPDSDSSFWDYSAHEMGYYDLAANMDYILNYTAQSKLSLVGFSEGTTMAFILGATKPEYNEKIKVLIAIAPVAFLQNTEGPLTFLIKTSPFLDLILPPFFTEFGGYWSLSKAFINLICTQLPISYDLCYSAITNPVIGPHYAITEEFFPVIVGHFPAGTSRRNLVHLSQMGHKGFLWYDYGPIRNLEVYKTFVPPPYDLSLVKFDTYLISGGKDRVSTIKDVGNLKDKLPNVADWLIVEEYNHLDHMWAWDADRKVYDYVLRKLNAHN